MRSDNQARIFAARRIAWFAAAVVVAASIGMIVYWRVPGLSLQVQDGLMRLRGALPPSQEIVIVAIDEKSLSKFGRFPWSRRILAEAIERIAAAGPRSIALDVLIADPTELEADQALAGAIERAGRVVVAAQLIQTRNGQAHAEWLSPLPEIESAAAATGHVNIQADGDGVARLMMLRQSDDDGRDLWAMTAEAIRIADSAPPADLRELPEEIGLGRRRIPVRFNTAPMTVASANGDGPVETVRASTLTINYCGPTGSFAPRTVSIADLIDGRVPKERLRDRIVLIGTTANALGDRLVSPFTRNIDANATLMPGVEILANSIQTIISGSYIRSLPDWLAALCALLVAAGAIMALGLAHGRADWTVSLVTLILLAALLPGLACLAFFRYSLVLPIVPMYVSFLAAVPLALLHRNRIAGIELDSRILELTSRERALANRTDTTPVPMIARLTGAGAVCILRGDGRHGDYLVAARHGLPMASVDETRSGPRLKLRHSPYGSVNEALVRDVAASGMFITNEPVRAITLSLGAYGENSGALLLAYPPDKQPAQETLQICREMASSWLASAGDRSQSKPRFLRGPRGIEWKINTLGTLQKLLLGRAGFIDRAMRSIEDGLLIADVDGRITFANPRAGLIFGLKEQSLIGRNLFHDLVEIWMPANGDPGRVNERLNLILTRLLIDRAPVEREIVIGPNQGFAAENHYMLRLGAVCEKDNGEGPVIGIVATFSDVTRHHELQQMKNDVLALVTHELRTPITAIQGMSEILSQHEYNAEQRREMHEAINEESKRLSRLIDEYLDLARLESGARALRRSPVRLAPLLERTMLMLEPVAKQRNIRLLRHFGINLPPVIADPDLLMQAANNLITNAIKYSPDGRDVIVETAIEGDEVRISVIDQGFGIPEKDREHIFEKFYRVSRSEQAEIPGTGLGLAFVREVMQLHGGRLAVESENGVGSKFTMYFSVESKKN